MAKEHSTTETRKKAVAAVRRRVPIAKVAVKLQVDRTTVLRWHQRYKEDGDAGLAQRPRSGRPRVKLPTSAENLRSIILKPALKNDRHPQLWTVSRLSNLLPKKRISKTSDKTDTLRRRLAEVGIDHPKPSSKVRESYETSLADWNITVKEIRSTVKKEKARLFAIRKIKVFVERLAGGPEAVKLSTRTTGKKDDREYVVALFAISDKRRLVFQFYPERPSTADIASFVQRLYERNKRRPLAVVLPYAREHNPVIKHCAATICPRLRLYEIPTLAKAKASKKKAMKLDPSEYVDCCFAKLFNRRTR